jgi:hypothetical protein
VVAFCGTAGVIIGIVFGIAIWPGEEFLDLSAFANPILLSMLLGVFGVVLAGGGHVC